MEEIHKNNRIKVNSGTEYDSTMNESISLDSKTQASRVNFFNYQNYGPKPRNDCEYSTNRNNKINTKNKKIFKEVTRANNNEHNISSSSKTEAKSENFKINKQNISSNTNNMLLVKKVNSDSCMKQSTESPSRSILQNLNKNCKSILLCTKKPNTIKNPLRSEKIGDASEQSSIKETRSKLAAYIQSIIPKPLTESSESFIMPKLLMTKSRLQRESNSNINRAHGKKVDSDSQKENSKISLRVRYIKWLQEEKKFFTTDSINSSDFNCTSNSQLDLSARKYEKRKRVKKPYRQNTFDESTTNNKSLQKKSMVFINRNSRRRQLNDYHSLKHYLSVENIKQIHLTQFVKRTKSLDEPLIINSNNKKKLRKSHDDSHTIDSFKNELKFRGDETSIENIRRYNFCERDWNTNTESVYSTKKCNEVQTESRNNDLKMEELKFNSVFRNSENVLSISNSKLDKPQLKNTNSNKDNDVEKLNSNTNCDNTDFYSNKYIQTTYCSSNIKTPQNVYYNNKSNYSVLQNNNQAMPISQNNKNFDCNLKYINTSVQVSSSNEFNYNSCNKRLNNNSMVKNRNSEVDTQERSHDIYVNKIKSNDSHNVRFAAYKKVQTIRSKENLLRDKSKHTKQPENELTSSLTTNCKFNNFCASIHYKNDNKQINQNVSQNNRKNDRQESIDILFPIYANSIDYVKDCGDVRHNKNQENIIYCISKEQNNTNCSYDRTDCKSTNKNEKVRNFRTVKFNHSLNLDGSNDFKENSSFYSNDNRKDSELSKMHSSTCYSSIDHDIELIDICNSSIEQALHYNKKGKQGNYARHETEEETCNDHLMTLSNTLSSNVSCISKNDSASVTPQHQPNLSSIRGTESTPDRGCNKFENYESLLENLKTDVSNSLQEVENKLKLLKLIKSDIMCLEDDNGSQQLKVMDSDTKKFKSECNFVENDKIGKHDKAIEETRSCKTLSDERISNEQVTHLKSKECKEIGLMTETTFWQSCNKCDRRIPPKTIKENRLNGIQSKTRGIQKDDEEIVQPSLLAVEESNIVFTENLFQASRSEENAFSNSRSKVKRTSSKRETKRKSALLAARRTKGISCNIL